MFRRWAHEDDQLDPALKDWYRTIELPRLVSLHGDVTLAARLSGSVLPTYAVPQALLVLDYGREVVMRSSGAAGKCLTIPWEQIAAGPWWHTSRRIEQARRSG